MSRGHPDFTRYTKYLDMIKGMGEVGITLVRAELLRNPSFEIGDLTGWNYRDAEISTDVIGEATGKYSCRIKPGGAISQITPLFKCSKFKLVIAMKGEDPNTSHLRVVITHPDLTYTTIDWTGFGSWSWRTWEPTTDKRVVVIGFVNRGECDIWVDELQTWLAPQEREITNWPAEYPLPDTQVADLKTVSVDNLPANYPLPTTQITDLKKVILAETAPILYSGNPVAAAYPADVELVPGVTGEKIKISDIFIWNNGTASLTGILKEGATEHYKFTVATESGWLKTFLRRWELADGASLVINISGEGFNVVVHGVQE